MKFQTVRSRKFRDTTEAISDNSAKEIGETRASCSKSFPPLFSEKEYIGNLIGIGTYVYPIKISKFQVWKIRVSLTNPRSAELGWASQIGKI